MTSNLVILQARMSSTRLPGKVMAEVNGRPMIEWQIRRIQQSDISEIVLATTSSKDDDDLVNLAESLGVITFRGSTIDVYSRYKEILHKHTTSNFIRLTGDCPLVMPDLIDKMIGHFWDNECDYLSNTNPPTFPDGLDVEVVRSSAFLNLDSKKLSVKEKEHVTLSIYQANTLFKILNYENTSDMSDLRWTVDYQDDLNFVRDVYSKFAGQELDFRTSDILRMLALGEIVENNRTAKFRNVALQEEF